MAVSGDCRRIGIGNTLLGTALNFAREYGYEEVILRTPHFHHQAIQFYENNGFRASHSVVRFISGIPFNVRFFRIQLLIGESNKAK